MPAEDTIFALSSGAPPAGIAVIRVSGPRAGEVLRTLSGRMTEARQASLVSLRGARGELLDRALVLWLPGPATATGEDLVELHLHGGRAVIRAVEAALAEQPGLRRAGPGEFTRRAFDNGRIDLAEAEGLADLLSAETESQRRQAINMAGGATSRLTNEWRDALLSLSARVEATLDFADEDDVPEVDPGLLREMRRIADDVAHHLQRPPVERLRDGVRVVLAGPPNSGKSTLFNALVGREAAITSPVAGTTRDLIEAPVAIDGMPFLLIDTAGLRESDDQVEEIGVARAEAALAVADLILWLGPPELAPPGSIRVRSQADRVAASTESYDIAVSAVTRLGLNQLLQLLRQRADALLPTEGEVTFNLRQRAALDDARSSLELAKCETDLLLLAEALRLALDALGRVTGRAGVEEMLDTLFGRFCIGK